MKPGVLYALVLLTACSSNSNGGNPATGTDSGAKPSDTSVGDVDPDVDPDAAEPECDPTVDHPAGAVCVHQIRGKVVAQDGTALPSVIVSVCGSVCYFSRTGDDGYFVAHVGELIVPARFQVLVHGRPDYASSYTRLTVAPIGLNMEMPAPLAVPKYDATGPIMPADGAPAATVTAGDVTLSIPGGTELDLDVEDVANGDEGRRFRSVKWTSATPPDFVAGENVLQLYALAPFAAKTCTKRPCDDTNLVKMAVTLPNATSLTAGTVVEFITLGTDLYGPPVTIGQLLVAGTGKVSADGKTITSDPGEGITVMSFVGVRVKK